MDYQVLKDFQETTVYLGLTEPRGTRASQECVAVTLLEEQADLELREHQEETCGRGPQDLQAPLVLQGLRASREYKAPSPPSPSTSGCLRTLRTTRSHAQTVPRACLAYRA